MPRSKHASGARRTSPKFRQRSDLDFSKVPTAPLSAERATQFVKLLHAGLPPIDAVAYIIPEADEPTLKTLAGKWANDDLVLQATIAFTKGEWADLEPEQRLVLARDKYLAEQAYFLYTRQAANLSDEERPKARYAYDVITDYLKTVEQVDDPVARFLRDMRDAMEKSGTSAVVITDDEDGDAVEH